MGVKLGHKKRPCPLLTVPVNPIKLCLQSTAAQIKVQFRLRKSLGICPLLLQQPVVQRHLTEMTPERKSANILFADTLVIISIIDKLT